MSRPESDQSSLRELTPEEQSALKYKIGDSVKYEDGKEYVIKGFFTDGTPNSKGIQVWLQDYGKVNIKSLDQYNV